MRNIEELLNEVFRYERDEHPLLAKLIEENRKQSDPPGFCNVRVESPRYGVYGIRPMWTFDNRGNKLYYYSAEKNWKVQGPPLDHPKLSSFRDCANTHIGVLVNCLAYMSDKPWQSLHVVRMAVDGPDKYHQLKSYRPDIAELFLSVLTGVNREPERTVSPDGGQFAIFQK